MYSLAIIAVGTLIGFIFFRRQTKKILLSIALSIVAGGVLRLIQEAGNDEAIWPALIAISVMGVVWLVSWTLNRSITPKRPAKAQPKRRSVPPRVNLR